MKTSTLLANEPELFNRLEAEGVERKGVCVIAPRWAETAPKSPEAKSGLARPDLILRSDGSLVCIDGAMGRDSLFLGNLYLGNVDQPNYRSLIQRWFPEVRDTDLPPKDLLHLARATVGWEVFITRLKSLVM